MMEMWIGSWRDDVSGKRGGGGGHRILNKVTAPHPSAHTDGLKGCIQNLGDTLQHSFHGAVTFL